MFTIGINLGNGKKLFADVCPEDSYKEIFIGVEDIDGDYRDLAVVREKYAYEGNKVVPIHDSYEVLVWGDNTTDYFTHKIDIKAYEDEQE